MHKAFLMEKIRIVKDTHVVGKDPGLSKREVASIALSLAILTVTYLVIMLHLKPVHISRGEYLEIAAWAAVCIVCVTLSFGINLAIQKVVASHLGIYAEYRTSYIGTILTVLAAALFFYVPLVGMVDKDDDGDYRKVGAVAFSGVASNIILVSASFVILNIVSKNIGFWIVFTFAYANLITAIVGMIPVRFLDGYRILFWSKIAYVVMTLILLTMSLEFLSICGRLPTVYFN